MSEINLEQRLYVKNKEKWLKAYEKSYHSSRKLETKEIDDGIILPVRKVTSENYEGGVCDKDFNFLGGLINNPDKSGSQKFVYDSYTVPEEEIEYVDETVVFGGVLLNHPGHLLRDSFAARLWWHVSNPDSKLRIAFITLWEDRIWGGGTHNFIKEFIDLLGIPDERVLFIKQPTQFTKLLIPDQCIYYNFDFTDEFISVIDKIASNVEEGQYDKVYFTKKLTEHNDMINEDYFCEFFKRKGYTIINPEDYTLKEKVSICKGAKEFASVNGTNSIYVLFCKPDVKLFVLERTDDDLSHEAFLNQAKGIKDFYSITVSLSFLSNHYVWGTKLLGVTDEWKRFVKDIYGEEITETTEDSLKQHSFDYLKAFAEYTAQPQIFEIFKRYDHYKILETMNRLFLGRTLDPKNYNIERLQDYRKQITSYKEQISVSRAADARQNELLEKLAAGVMDRLSSGMNIEIPERENVLRSLVRPEFMYSVHNGKKWGKKVRGEETAGDDGSAAPVISFRIDPVENTPNMFYSVFTAEEGWMPDVHEGQNTPAVKRQLAIKGLRIRFDDKTSELFSVRYRVHTRPKGWTAWVADGKATPWRNCDMIDAVQVQVVQKEDYDEKIGAVCDKFFSEFSKAIDSGVQALKNREAKSKAAEISALKNKIAAQEYVIKSLERTLAAIVNNKKDEG